MGGSSSCVGPVRGGNVRGDNVRVPVFVLILAVRLGMVAGGQAQSDP